MNAYVYSIDDHLNSNNVGFYFDYQNGTYGYNTSANRGADTFSPFKGSFTKTLIGTVNGSLDGVEKATISCASIDGYSNFTIDNFICEITRISVRTAPIATSSELYNGPPGIVSYTALTGDLVVRQAFSYYRSGTGGGYLQYSIGANLYVIK